MTAIWIILGILTLVASILFIGKRMAALALEDVLFVIVAVISGIILLLHGLGVV